MGECSFWYWPTRVVPGHRPLNGCVCVCEQYTVDCLTTLGTDDIDDLSSQFL